MPHHARDSWQHRSFSPICVYSSKKHYSAAITSQITSLTIVYSTVYSDADQRKHQSSTSLAFVWGIHRRPVNSPHKWPVTRKMFPFHDAIMNHQQMHDFAQAYIKESSKLRATSPSWGKKPPLTGGFPSQKGQLRVTRFHWMTPSWICVAVVIYATR